MSKRVHRAQRFLIEAFQFTSVRKESDLITSAQERGIDEESLKLGLKSMGYLFNNGYWRIP